MTAISRHLILRPAGLTNWWALVDRATGRRIVYAGHVQAALFLSALMERHMQAGITFDEAYFNALKEAS